MSELNVSTKMELILSSYSSKLEIFLVVFVYLILILKRLSGKPQSLQEFEKSHITSAGFEIRLVSELSPIGEIYGSYRVRPAHALLFPVE